MSNAAKLKKRAAEFEQKKMFDKALQLYVQALQESEGAEDDGDVALYNRVGDLLMRAGNVNESLTYYEKAVDLYADRGFLNNAIALCNKILRQSPSRTTVYYKLGRISATKGFKTDAKKNFLEYADRMQKAGKIDEAFRALKEFADLCPDQDDIRLMLAEQLSREGRKGEALDQLERLHEKLASEGRTTEARATVDRMKAIDPEFRPSATAGVSQQPTGDLVFLDLSDEPPRASGGQRPVSDPDLVAVRAAGKDARSTIPPEYQSSASPSDALALILPDDLGPPIVEPALIDLEPASPEAPVAETSSTLEGLELTTLETPVAAPAAGEPLDLGDLLVGNALPAGEPDLVAPAEAAHLSGDPEWNPEPVAHEELLPELDVATPPPSPEPASIAMPDSLEELGIDASHVAGSSSEAEPIAPGSPEEPVAEPAAVDRARGLDEWGIGLADDTREARAEALTLESSLEAALSSDAAATPDAGTEAPIARASDIPDDEAWRRAFPEDIGDALPATWSSSAPTVAADELLDLDEALEASAPSASSADAELARAEALELGELVTPTLPFEATRVPAIDAIPPDQVRPVGAPALDLGAAGELVHEPPPSIDEGNWPRTGAGDDPFAFPMPSFGAAVHGNEPAARPLSESPIPDLDGLGLVEGAESLTEHANEAVSREAEREDAWMHASADAAALDAAATHDEAADVTGRAPETTSHAPGEVIEGAAHQDSGEQPHEVGAHPAASRDRDTGSDLATIVEGDLDARAPGLESMTDEYPAPVSLEALAEVAASLITPSDAPIVDARRVEALRDRVTAAPGDWSLRRELAEALLEIGRREDGLAELESAMVGLELEGRYDDAETLIEELLGLEPDSVRLLQKRVEFAVRSGDRSRLVEAYVALADGLFRAGEPDKAAVVYQRVLELSPDEARALAGMNAAGVTPPESAPAVPEAPAAPPSRSPRVEAHWSDEAESAPFAPVAASAGDDSFIDLGDLLREDELPRSTRMVTAEKAPTGDEQADFEEMLRRFKQGVAENVDEEDYDSHYDLGVAYSEMGLVDEAIAEFQKALRGSHGRTRAYEALGRCFVEKEQYQVAASVLRRALTLTEGNDDHTLVGVLYLLGQSCEHLGRPAEALDFYRRVFAVDIQFRDIADRITEMERMTQ